MSLKANACPRCLTLKTGEPGHVHTCSPTPLVRKLEGDSERLDRLQAHMNSDAGSYYEIQIPEPFDVRRWIDEGFPADWE